MCVCVCVGVCVCVCVGADGDCKEVFSLCPRGKSNVGGDDRKVSVPGLFFLT